MEPANALVVTVEDFEIDAANAHAVATRIRTAMLNAEQYSVVIDLDLVRFIDSSGLGALIEVRGLAAEHGGTVRLAKVQAQPTRTMQLAGLATVLPIVGDDVLTND